MSDKLTFVTNYTQTTGSVALGLSNIPIVYPTGYGNQVPMYIQGIFGVSVIGSSGAFGINLMGMCPDGSTLVVAGATALTTKHLFYATNVGGTTQSAGITPPYEIQFQRAVGTSISYTASVWGVMYNP